MNLSYQDNLPAFSDALRAFLRFSRMAIPAGLRYQGRLLAERLIQFTPPIKVDKTPRSQGRAAVKRDILNAIRPLKPASFRSPEIRKLIRAHKYEALQVVFHRMTNGGDWQNAQVVAFDPHWHRKAQRSRGHVTKYQRVVTPDADQVGQYVTKISVPDQAGPFTLPELLTDSLTYTGTAPPGVTPLATNLVAGKVRLTDAQADPIVATKVYADALSIAGIVYTDDRLAALNSFFLMLSGGTLTGPLRLENVTPQDDNQAAPKKYVDDTAVAAAAGKLDLAGGVMTGELILGGWPNVATAAVPKDYVDSGIADAKGYADSKSTQDRSYVDDAIAAISLTPGPVGPAGAAGPAGPQGPAWSPLVVALAQAPFVGIDFAAAQFQVATLNGDVVFWLTANRAAGKTASVRIVCDGTPRALSFNAGWKFISAKPTSLAANKEAILSLTCYGPDETDVRAVFAAEP